MISTDALSLWTSHSLENSSTRAPGSTNHWMISHSTMPIHRSGWPHELWTVSGNWDLVPSPMSASSTGLMVCIILLEWKDLDGGRRESHLLGAGRRLEGMMVVVVVVPAATETRLMRCASCHCNRTAREARGKNISNS